MAIRVASIPDGVDPNKKVPGLFPSLTIAQWNGAVDVISAEERSNQDSVNLDALEARDAIRAYLLSSGYRNPDAA